MDNLELLFDRFTALMRSRDYSGAVSFFKERVREALQAEEREMATNAASLLISSLIIAGNDEEAIDLVWRVVNSLPEAAFLRSTFAGFLLYSLKQPQQALEVLDPVFEELMALEGCRHATLGLRGTILFALGRVEEAQDSFREMLQPSLWRMDPSAFDFRLVESLISAGLMKEECKEYLNIAYHQAQQTNDEDVMARADHLRGLLS
ncbi:MAG TPA: hypothetical protein VGX68_27445 [Thermoanaerobaculia bacterium]|jgi:tetratricopeptide (TPR) repeat protein|nr:hypothetical protein [Thermoanaerobaculia bacterium]